MMHWFVYALALTTTRLPKPTLPFRSAAARAEVALEAEPDVTAPIPDAALDEADVPGVTRRVPKDQTAAAIDFFGSERTPAALVAGATISIIFGYPLKPVGDDPLIALVKRLYMMCAVASIANTLIAVFAASLAIVRLRSNVHEPIAKDALVMMLRETPVYFLAVRAHFLTGVLCFTAALSVRIWSENSIGSPLFARALLTQLGAAVCFMVSLFNTTLIHFESFGHLWWCYIQCLWNRLRIRNPTVGHRAGVLAAMAIVLTLYSTGAGAYVLYYYTVRAAKGFFA